MGLILNNTRFVLTNGSFFNNTPEILSTGIITNNLTHLFVAGDPASYSGTGTIWNNLVGPNDLELVNTPTFISNGAASRFVLDGTNDFMTGSGYLTGSAPKSHTLSFIGSFASLPGNFTRYRFFSDGNNPSSYAVQQNGSTVGVTEIAISQGTPTFNATIYIAPGGQIVSQSQTAMFTFVSKNTGVDVYLNGSLLGGSTTETFVDSSFTSPTTTFWWGANQNATTPLSMSFSQIMWYSASLSPSEILQNYNALKSTYGI